MDASTARPKLLFFQFRYDAALPPFLLIHKEEYVRCLEQFFDVTVVSHDCDYAEVCERVQPDLVLFESGVNHVTCHRPRITNTSAHPGIPRLALHNADAFCNARAGFVADLDAWGIEFAFAVSTTAAEHTPELADRLFVWPNAIDPALYRDYGAWKSIPVLLTGNANALYPWRRRVSRLLADSYPCLQLPHPGYESGASRVQLLYGERYARTINASVLVPTCGTVAREVVRKHFEIPACRTLLVTERCEALERAGFVDGESCVFTDEREVLDRLAHLFAHPDELQRITDAGFALVHARHTFAQRDQLRRWYDLHRARAPGERIVQPDPFSPLRLEPAGGPGTRHLRGDGAHLALLREGDERLRAGAWAEAAASYRRCMGYMPWMPEPRVRIALCELHLGDAAAAFRRLEEVSGFVLERYGSAEPDPVEWALRLVALLCLGRPRDAARDARSFPGLAHPLLDRARWAAAAAEGAAPPPPATAGRRRPTLHVLPETTFDAWLQDLRRMLAACGQRALAEALRPGEPSAGAAPPAAPERAAPRPSFRAYARRVARQALRDRLRRAVAAGLHRAERTFGPFLPYAWSIARRDEFHRSIQALVAGDGVGAVLAVGAAPGAAATEALLAGVRASAARPVVHCVTTGPLRARGARRHPAAAWGAVERSPGPLDVERALQGFAPPDGDAYDAVLVAGAVLGAPAAPDRRLLRAVEQAALVFLEGTGDALGHALLRHLLDRGAHAVVTADAGVRQGWAVLRRLTASRGAGTGAADRPRPAASPSPVAS